MKRNVKALLIGVALLVGVAVPALAQSGTGSSEGTERDVPISGPDLDKASEAALAHLGEGTVTDTEVEDEESYYEVEVTRDDGTQVDVQLDKAFNVVGAEDDGAGSDD